MYVSDWEIIFVSGVLVEAVSAQTIFVPWVSALCKVIHIHEIIAINVFTYRNKQLAKEENENISFFWRLNRFAIFAQEDLEDIKKGLKQGTVCNEAQPKVSTSFSKMFLF